MHVQADTGVPLLVLRRSLGPLQHGALGVARSAGRLGVPVHSVRASEREPATRSRYIRGPLTLPDLSHPDRRWVDALMRLSPELDGAILLPIDDRAAVTLGDHQSELGTRFRLAAQPDGLQRRLASKRELWRICTTLAIPTPDSRFPSTVEGALEAAREFGYPVVLKRSDPWLAPRDPGAPSVLIAVDSRELEIGYARMDSADAPQVMVQRYIPGSSDTIWMFNGYFDADSRCLCAFTGRKLRQRPPSSGPTTLGVCVHNQRVADTAKRLMTELGYHGIVDMGFRHDARDDQYKLLDVNPRLGSTFRLFVSAGGIDVVRAMHLDLTGLRVPDASTDEGRRWVNEALDLFTCGELARDHELTLRAWLRSLKGVEETAWWARDDPSPFLAMAAGLPAHLARAMARHRKGDAVEVPTGGGADH